jgi:hypothetical protein
MPDWLRRGSECARKSRPDANQKRLMRNGVCNVKSTITQPDLQGVELDGFEWADDEQARFRNKFRALEAGRAAHAKGDSLSDLVHVAMARWPFSTAQDLADLVAQAVRGYHQSKELGTCRKWRERLATLRREREALEAQRVVSARSGGRR